jgi:olefin beta-lactone synthetase
MSFINIAQRFEKTALNQGDKNALIVSHQRFSLSFTELDQRIKAITSMLREAGVGRGDRVLVFIKPGEHLAAVTFALFRGGFTPVFIDPGMGRKALLRCIEQAKPRVMIAESIVHLIRRFFPSAFRSIELAFAPRALRRAYKNSHISQIECAQTSADELAAILFTSGGTGAPKGVRYTHELFDTQTTLLQEMFGLNSSEVDCPGFPLFSLFTLCMGMTSVIPDMNAAKPSKANPKKLVRQILEHNVSFVAGSPAIWEKVAIYCLKNRITLPSLKWVVMFGAPVSLKIHRSFLQVLPNGTTYTPYGATEALPISLIDGKSILSQHAEAMERGRGWALGKIVSGCRVKIIPITEEALPNLDNVAVLAPYEIGEIIVQGPMVTKSYDGLEEATALSKINDPEQGFWHRMGDLGFLDEAGELWFCGRKTHRVITDEGLLSSIQCEAIFNAHPDVRRSALVGLPREDHQEPAIVVELRDSQSLSVQTRERLIAELKERAQAFGHTKKIEKIYFAKRFPVDVRHHIKIDRHQLRDQILAGKIQ